MLQRNRWLIVISIPLALVGLALVWLPAQTTGTPSVEGRVLLPDGQPAAGAWVRVQTTDNVVYASSDGGFVLTGLASGNKVIVTAWYPAYKVGWQEVEPPADDVTIVLQAYDPGDNPNYEWNTSYPDPSADLGCGHCMQPAFNEWRTTPHANSAVNARFMSLYAGTNLSGTKQVGAGYLNDFPGTAGNCATCHAPGAAFDAPYTTRMDSLSGVDREGVFCEFCHKVGHVYLDPATGRPYDNAPGTLSMRLHRPQEGDQLFFGSLDDVNRRVSYLPLEQKSEFCAPCHQFSYWGTPIYESFGEWQESAYRDQGIQCQTCHMPPGDTRYFALPDKGGLPRNPARLASHLDLGIRNQSFMTSSVSLSLETQATPKEITVYVEVTNIGAGHHIPTDHPGRHMILTVEAMDQRGNRLPLLHGDTVPAWGGAQAGMAGQTYVKLLEDAITGESPTVSYWKQTFIVSDTRLPALASRTSVFTFGTEDSSRTIRVIAELQYRRNFAALMEEKEWNEADLLLAREEVQLTVPLDYTVRLPAVNKP